MFIEHRDNNPKTKNLLGDAQNLESVNKFTKVEDVAYRTPDKQDLIIPDSAKEKRK